MSQTEGGEGSGLRTVLSLSPVGNVHVGLRAGLCARLLVLIILLFGPVRAELLLGLLVAYLLVALSELLIRLNPPLPP